MGFSVKQRLEKYLDDEACHVFPFSSAPKTKRHKVLIGVRDVQLSSLKKKTNTTSFISNSKENALTLRRQASLCYPFSLCQKSKTRPEVLR